MRSAIVAGGVVLLVLAAAWAGWAPAVAVAGLDAGTDSSRPAAGHGSLYASLFPCLADVRTAWGAPYMGLYTDVEHSDIWMDGTPPFSAEVWVWCNDDARGVMAAEFRVVYPPNVIPSTVTMNSAVSVYFGSTTSGMSAAFSSCQEGWAWVAHQTIWVLTADYSEVTLVPHPVSGLQIASCEMGYPIYPATVLSSILINCEGLLESYKPKLADINVVTQSSLLTTYTHEIDGGIAWPRGIPEGNFRVIEHSIPPDTLDVLDARFPSADVFGTCDSVILDLGQNLTLGSTYTVEATHMCSEESGYCGTLCVGYFCADSEKDFTFATVAALLADFSAGSMPEGVRVSWTLGVPAGGISFMPMRLEKGAAAFEPLDAPVIEEGVLRYRFVDEGALPGSSFRYRVVYGSEGELSTLFETDWVETSAARFALHQNLPNPFNPSTRISFELGSPCRAALAVYDVSGKLVRVLADDELSAGAHSVVWDGRNDSGEGAASGIYFYRLRAGSFTETKKLVLLR